MANFNISLQRTLLHEGGYVHDPIDTGGETYKGISRNAHPRWAGWKIIDTGKEKSDFPASLDKDIELQKQVELFYLYEFWLPLKGDLINNQYKADSLFDFSVNVGLRTCIRSLQSLINADIDGIVGVQTLKNLNAFETNPFLAFLALVKIEYYIDSIKKRSSNKKYLYGWLLRALGYSK